MSIEQVADQATQETPKPKGVRPGTTVQMESGLRTALENKIQSMLDGNTPDEPSIDDVVEEAQADDTEPSDVTVTEDTDESLDSEPVAETDEAAVESEEQEVSTDNAPTLPDSHRRSLKAYGWTDETIDTNLKSLGAQFIDTANRIHENRTQETATWAAKGRELREQQSKSPQPYFSQQPTETPTPVLQGTPSKLAAVNVKALAEKYGDEELVKEIAGPVNDLIERVNQILPQIEAGQKAIADSHTEALDRQFQSFFASDDLKPYAEIYGEGQNVTQDQFDARMSVLDEADAILVGSKYLGRPKTFSEALQIAHDSIASRYHADTAQRVVREQAIKRARAVSAKPSARKAPPQPKTAADKATSFENKVAAGLKKAFT